MQLGITTQTLMLPTLPLKYPSHQSRVLGERLEMGGVEVREVVDGCDPGQVVAGGKSCNMCL